MFKLPPFLTVAVLILVVIMVFRNIRMVSSYKLNPTPISINPKATGSIVDLPYNTGCVPGPTEEASYYTKDLTPGGVCGAQKFVDAQASYSILGGIGGSLMDQ